MKSPASIVIAILFTLIVGYANSQSEQAINPVIHADVPDISRIRVGNIYYMSSTTMHMAPGVPIMKSTDMVNWEIVNYAYNWDTGLDCFIIPQSSPVAKLTLTISRLMIKYFFK